MIIKKKQLKWVDFDILQLIWTLGLSMFLFTLLNIGCFVSVFIKTHCINNKNQFSARILTVSLLAKSTADQYDLKVL